jgi:ubiquinone/menaquinone biosynthesis C-methylase UbiE
VIRKDQDAYGAEMLAAYKTAGYGILEIVERSDGYIDFARTGPVRYFSDRKGWSKRERAAIQNVRGRVLDIGCGAGRFALYLQSKGHSVTAIDNSSGAIKVCKLRGVESAMVRSIAEIGKFKAGSFDTILMMGNNFGLFGSRKKAKRLLREMFRITTEQGQIIAEATDPYQTSEPVHLQYLKLNRSRGRMSGQLRLRIRHKKVIGQWFDYLFVSQKEMKTILDGTGWGIKKVHSEGGPSYTVVMGKKEG